MTTNTIEAALKKAAPIAKRKLNQKTRVAVFCASAPFLIETIKDTDMPESKTLADAIMKEVKKISQSEIALLAKWGLTRKIKDAELTGVKIKGKDFVDNEGNPYLAGAGERAIWVNSGIFNLAHQSPYWNREIHDLRWPVLLGALHKENVQSGECRHVVFDKAIEVPCDADYKPHFAFTSVRRDSDKLNQWYITEAVKKAADKVTIAKAKLAYDNKRRCASMAMLMDMAVTVGEVVEALPFTADVFSAHLSAAAVPNLPVRISKEDKERLCTYMKSHAVEGSTLCK